MSGFELRSIDRMMDWALSRPEWKRARPRTFRDALVVFGSATSPRVLALAAAAALGARVGVGDLSLLDAIIPIALLAVWPVQEWLIHVFVLHAKPKVVFGLPFDPPTPRSHRRHHADPNDLAEVFIPLWVFPYALPLMMALWFLLPTPLALTGLASNLLLALHYEWCHYIAHVPYTPKFAHYKKVCRDHMLHHFHHEQYWMGVSMHGGDRLLGTGPEPTAVPRSEHCRDLGMAPG